MNTTAPKTVALQALPKLVLLIQTRKQARWQWKHGADEHKHHWTMVLDILDRRIGDIERYIGNTMDIDGFRAKREIVE